MKKQITIVTGASSNHLVPLKCLLWTIARFEPSARVIVYDLGLTAGERAELQDVPPVYLANWELRTFDFTKYPPHCAIGAPAEGDHAGRMAFRPIVLNLVAAALPASTLFWLDAGCQLRRRLDTVWLTVQQQGCACANAPERIGKAMLPSAAVTLKITDDLKEMRLMDPGACAFDLARPAMRTFLQQWQVAVLDPVIAVPSENSPWVHRHPDVVFTVLFRRFAERRTPTLLNLPMEAIRMRCDWMTLRETQFQITGR